MKNIKEAFGANLRQIRKSKKITIETLAEKSGISSRLLSNIEAGDTFVSAESLCKICVALDIEPKELFDFEWYDKFMYYDNGKYIRPHFKIVLKEKFLELKSLPSLNHLKINKKFPLGKDKELIADFSKRNKLTVYIDHFIGKERDKIEKYSPDGTYSSLCDKQSLKKKFVKNDKSYFDVIEKVKEFAKDEKTLAYLLMAINSLDNKKARDKLRLMLDAMDISK